MAHARSFLVVPFVLAACVGDAPAVPDAGGPTGSEGGACFTNGTCNAGLVCVVPNTCVKPAVDGGVDTGPVGDAGKDAFVPPPCPVTQLLAYWKADNSGKDELGAFDLSATQQVTYGAGHVGQAFNFTGTQWLDSTALLSDHAAFTIEAWVNTTVVTKGTILSTKTNTAGMIFSLYNGFPNIMLGATTLSGNGGKIVVAGAWTHLAIAFDSVNVRFFVNGTLNATKPLAGGVVKEGPIRVGSGWLGEDPFNGLVDEVAIYGKALSDTEVKDLYLAAAAKCR
jgi:hypothetical protein